MTVECNLLDELDKRGHDLTDTGNALRMVDSFGADLAFVPEWGWMVWDGKRWQPNELLARDLATEAARMIYAEAANVVDKEYQKAVTSHGHKSQSANAIKSMLWLAQPKLVARVDQFDRETMLLPVLNGTLDLRTRRLHKHRREHYSTRLAPILYEESATCPEWDKFLARVIPDTEVREFIKRLAGYSLSGSTTAQILVFLYGSGRNGKSVFVEILAALLGDYHTATRIETLSNIKGGIPNDVAALAGSRLVTVSETPEGSRLNESLVKDLTGGDIITARFLRAEFFQFTPQFKIWIRGNHKPRIHGTDDGIWRRMMLIPFTVQIPDAEVDPDLPERLRAELPGILNWALDGCLQWQSEGLKPPRSVLDAVSEYRSEMDLLGQFVNECCIVATQAKASASALYAQYRQWCDESGTHPVTKTRFGLALGERGFEKRTPKTVIWHGIGLLSDSSDSCDSSTSSRYTRAHDSRNAEKGSQLSDYRNDWEGDL